MRKIKHGQVVGCTAAAALLILGCGMPELEDTGGQQEISTSGPAALHSRAVREHRDARSSMRSHGHPATDERGRILFSASPTGWTPDDLRSAYKLPSSGGSGKTIAIVDPYDNPYAEDDLAVYRAQFGLPPCTTANGCFQKVNQDGKSSPLPSSVPDPDCASTDWQFEIALDLDMASAGCPDCKILLVEAKSCYLNDLGAAELTAVGMGAAVVSNSWGGSEARIMPDTSTDAMYFNHPDVSIFFSSGDDGYDAGPQYPASSQYVTAVGGTTLSKNFLSFRGWNENAWGGPLSAKGSGSGCSQIFPKPSWQKDILCGKRMIADVAAVAKDVAVYQSHDAEGGWTTAFGTSVATPLVAAIYAITRNEKAGPSLPYKNRGAFFDVIFGSTGICLLRPYFCASSLGYDGPTGIGTPNGSSL